MDRNAVAVDSLVYIRQVALRKESVDRNDVWRGRQCINGVSLSARRAWIEIFRPWNLR